MDESAPPAVPRLLPRYCERTPTDVRELWLGPRTVAPTVASGVNQRHPFADHRVTRNLHVVRRQPAERDRARRRPRVVDVALRRAGHTGAEVLRDRHAADREDV